MWVLTIGILMIVVTVSIHAIGSGYWLGYLGGRIKHRAHSHQSLNISRGILSTAVVLLMLHIVEVLLWASVYISLPGHAGLSNYAEAVYFSMVTLTTLGYGDITLSVQWQLLAGMEAMVGILVFGLTTATLFAVIQRSWKFKHLADKPGKHGIDSTRS
jgi:voltage-gated potassium channel